MLLHMRRRLSHSARQRLLGAMGGILLLCATMSAFRPENRLARVGGNDDAVDVRSALHEDQATIKKSCICPETEQTSGKIGRHSGFRAATSPFYTGKGDECHSVRFDATGNPQRHVQILGRFYIVKLGCRLLAWVRCRSCPTAVSIRKIYLHPATVMAALQLL
eukprot:COSAG01_NODE_221_length_21422_cov_48.284294_7_plen_163_part_00